MPFRKEEFTDVAEDICYLLQVCRHKLETNNYDELETEIRKANDLNGQLSHLKTRRAATHPKPERQHQSQHGIPDI